MLQELQFACDMLVVEETYKILQGATDGSALYTKESIGTTNQVVLIFLILYFLQLQFSSLTVERPNFLVDPLLDIPKPLRF